MNNQNKTKKELIAQLQDLEQEHESLKKLYLREKNENREENSTFQKEREWLDYVLEVTRTGIDIMDANFNLHFVDMGWQKFYGNPKGRKCYEYFMGKEEPCVGCGVPEALKKKHIIIKEEFLKKENRIVEVHTIPFQNDEGEWLVAEFNIDISERKKAEIELVKAKEKAEQNDRLKTVFLQNISHEIRTPLNSIMGFSERINMPNLADDKRKLYSDIILKSSSQLLSIVSDILSISLIDTGQETVNIDKVCINSIISEAETIFNREIGEKPIKLTVVKSIPEKYSTVFSDRTKLYQILSNLLSNAIKFTDSGEIEFACTMKKNTLEFYVKDTGIGIDKSKQDIIFNRFVQADKTIQANYGGTGLGLSICKGLVELMGGSIWLDSEVGKGSTFFFTIPLQS